MLRFLAFSALLAASFSAGAQLPFTEGVATYDVRIRDANGQESLGTQAGMYKLTLKGSQVRRDLKMNNGFEATTIYDSRTAAAVVLQVTTADKFAVRLTPEQWQARNAQYSSFTLKTRGGKGSEVAGFDCQPAVAGFADNNTEDLCISDIPLPQQAAFERYPGIEKLPLIFEHRTKKGSVIQFRLESLQRMPVEDAQFRVPAGYKELDAAALGQ